MRLQRLAVFYVMALAGGGAPTFAAPPNDNFSDATVIAGFPAQSSETTVEATFEQDEPMPTSWFDEEGSIWFSWTASTSTAVRVSTGESDYNAIFAVWSGNELDTLALIGLGWDGDVYFESVSGQTYRISAYGSEWNNGTVVISIGTDESAHIDGVVTTTNGATPVPGIDAIIYEWQYDDDPEDGFWWSITRATTDADGAYSARGLLPGTYRVLFYDPNFYYERQAFSNAPDIATGHDITLEEGERIGNINAALVAGATIAGHVTEMDGSTPIQGIHAQAFRWNGSTWTEAGEANTDADGNYLISGLPAGLYRVRFSQWREYLWEVYDDVPYETWSDMAAGQDLVLATSEALTGINADMVPASKISGLLSSTTQLVPVEGIWIRAWRWDGAAWIESGVSDMIGCCGGDPDFLIAGLRPGTYRITFEDLTGEFESAVWGGGADLSEGLDIVVPATTTVAGIHQTLNVVTPSIFNMRQTNADAVEFDFNGLEGRTYVLQHAPTVSDDWEDVGDPIWADGEANSLPLTNLPPESGFWRIRRVFTDE